MEIYTILFYVFAAITLGGACIVVFSKNIVRAAFSLLFAFFGVAGIYVFLMADFLAITQLLIYVGGILVLILFGVMLTTNYVKIELDKSVLNKLPAFFITLTTVLILLHIFWHSKWNVTAGFDFSKTAPQIGELLLTKYLIQFEIASILLLIALIGAAMIARREKK